MIDLRAMASAFKHQALHFFADPQWIIPSLVAPFTFTLVVLFIYHDVDGPVVLQAVLGGGVLGMWGNTLYSSGWSLTYDRMNGTIEPLMISPTPLLQVTMGRAIWNAFIGLVNALLIFVVAEAAYQTGISLKDPALFFIALTATLVSLASIGLLFSAFFVLTRASSVLMSTLEFPIYVLSGAMFPFTVLPLWSRPLSYVLAPSWGVDALRVAGIEGYQAVGNGFWWDILIMFLLTLAYIGISFVLFHLLEYKAREYGTLGRY